MEVPESILKKQTRNVMYDIARQRLAMGMTQEQVSEQQEEILKEAEKQAEESVKLRYIGLAIAAEKEFEADEVDVDDQIAAMAVERRTDARTLRKEMEKDGTISSVYEQVRFNKAFDYMLEQAKIK
jgi:trigger factor